MRQVWAKLQDLISKKKKPSKWKEPKNIMLRGVSQAQKDKGQKFSLIFGRRQTQIQTQALS
jgi:hypothetical protein